jgi:hypothetical protein
MHDETPLLPFGPCNFTCSRYKLRVAPHSRVNARSSNNDKHLGTHNITARTHNIIANHERNGDDHLVNYEFSTSINNNDHTSDSTFHRTSRLW